MPKPKIAIVYYSMYGHVRTLALAEKKGLESAGCEVTLLKVPETLSDEVLGKMGAPGVGKDDEEASAAVWKSKFYGAFVLIIASSSTPSTRRLLDGVAMPVPHRSTEPGRPRHRRELT